MKWIDAKIRTNIIPILFWILVRGIFVTSFYIIDLDVSFVPKLYGSNISDAMLCEHLSFINFQSDTYKYTLGMAISFFVLSALIYDILDLIKLKRSKTYLKFYDLNGRKKIIANTFFFILTSRILQLMLLAITVLSLLFLSGLLQISETVMTIFAVLRALIPVILMWTLIYLCQLLPGIGPSIISIQSMYYDMIKFFILLLVFTLPFIHAFQTYMLYNSNTGCHEDFSGIQVTIYTMFLVMMNEYDTDDLQVRNIGIFKVMHVAFVFNIGILLLNFLIAIMASRASVIQTNKNVTLKLNQLALVVRLEDRIYWCTKWLYKNLSRTSFHCEDGKVYIVHESDRLDALFEGKSF